MASMEPLAILVSGGLDSAVLVGESLTSASAVHPLYLRTGLAWEDVELVHLHRFLAAIAARNLQPLVVLDQPVRDLYGDHWSTMGAAPGATAPDEEFYLPGRNVVLLSKALLWCRLNQVPVVAMAVLAANPFPDATPEFFRDYAAVVGRAVGGELRIVTPYASLSKAEVVRRGRGMPLQYTFSCASPIEGRHCGVCGKCAERGRAFLTAGVPDPTDYANRAWEGTVQRPADRRPWE